MNAFEADCRNAQSKIKPLAARIRFFNRTFGEVRPVSIDGQETGAFPIEMLRFRTVMKAIAYAMYYRDFGKRNDGDFEVFSPSLNSRANLYQDRLDPWENLRRIFESRAFKSMPVPQPKVFKYGLASCCCDTFSVLVGG